MLSDKAVGEILARLERLSLPEQAVAERQAIEAVDRRLDAPRLGQQVLRAEQPEDKDLLAIARLKESHFRVTQRLDLEASLGPLPRHSTQPQGRAPQPSV